MEYRAKKGYGSEVSARHLSANLQKLNPSLPTESLSAPRQNFISYFSKFAYEIRYIPHSQNFVCVCMCPVPVYL
jgi:hypothetical protein